MIALPEVKLPKLNTGPFVFGGMPRRSESPWLRIITPHSELQRRMVETPGNIVVLAGRRFGKTEAMVQRLFRSMALTPGLYWWVGLSWRSASMKRAWRLVTRAVRKLAPQAEINRSSFEVRIPGLGEIWFRTAANPESLAGEGIRGAVLDEFTLMDEDVWTEYLEGTLIDYGGWVAMVGVPKGLNWAAKMYITTRDGSLPGWTAFHATSYDNPLIPHERIDAIKERLGNNRLFRQEYMAEILEDAGNVFRHVAKAATAEEHVEPRAGRTYVLGVDWGRTDNETVIAVLDAVDKALVWIERYRATDYVRQLEHMRALNERYRPLVIVAEYNSMGGPMVEMARKMGMPVVPFTTSPATKQDAVDRLALAFDYGQIRILPDSELIEQLQAFEAKQMPSGHMRYGAPSGMRDDMVMALAFAWWGAQDDHSLRPADELLAEAFRL